MKTKRSFLLLIVLCLLTTVLYPQFTEAASTYYKSSAIILANGQKLSLERQPVNVNGRVLVPARTVFSKLGARIDWYSSSGKVYVVTGNKKIEMKIGSSSVSINGSSTKMDTCPVLVNGTVMVPLRQVAEALGAELKISGSNIDITFKGGSEQDGKMQGYKVVIDAGHGGANPGAVVGGTSEESLNLDIANRLNGLLTKEGITTYMTREKDVDVGLYDRSGLANKVNADLLISIHNNTHSNTSISGSMSLYYPGDSKTNGKLTSKSFASIVQNKLTGILGTKDLGIIERPNLAVLRTSNMPAVIAEVAYMTNSKELAKLNTSEYRQAAAQALRDAVIEALNKI